MDHTDAFQNRTAPTKDQVLVPETLLKKRKAQEKAREQRNSDIEKRKKVSERRLRILRTFGDDTTTNHATRLRSMLSLC